MDYAPYAGKLDKKITVYRRDKSKDDLGADVDTLVQVCETYACLDSSLGDLVADEKVRSIVTNTFTIRKRNGIVGVDNLEVHYGASKYRIHHVREIKRSHLVLICKDYD